MAGSEFDIIRTCFQSLTHAKEGVLCGIGDDAAVLEVPEGHDLAVCMDTLVSGVHFKADVDPCDLGFKSLAVNLSDMAAIGAMPMWATLSLTLPGSDASWLKGFSSGLADLANQHRVALVGGDLSRGPLSVTVQVTGLLPKGHALVRSGAQVNDDIYVSGYPGAAAMALMGVSTPYCRTRLNRPAPRVELGLALRGLAHAAIDISDGMYADLSHIVSASGVGAEVWINTIPLHEEIKGSQNTSDFWQIVLCTGDDYEIAFTASEHARDKIFTLAKDFDFPVTRIGKATQSPDTHWLLEDGTAFHPEKTGYNHFC